MAQQQQQDQGIATPEEVSLFAGHMERLTEIADEQGKSFVRRIIHKILERDCGDHFGRKLSAITRIMRTEEARDKLLEEMTSMSDREAWGMRTQHEKNITYLRKKFGTDKIKFAWD